MLLSALSLLLLQTSPAGAQSSDTDTPVPNYTFFDGNPEGIPDGEWVSYTAEGADVVGCETDLSIDERGSASIVERWRGMRELRLFTAHTEQTQVQINTNTRDHGGPWLSSLTTVQARSLPERHGVLQAAEVQLAINDGVFGDLTSYQYSARLRRVGALAGQIDLYTTTETSTGWNALATIESVPDNFDDLPVTLKVEANIPGKRYGNVTVLIGTQVFGPFDASAHEAGREHKDDWDPSMTLSLEASTDTDCGPRSELANLSYDLDYSGVFVSDGFSCATSPVLDALPCLEADVDLAPTCGGQYVDTHVARGEQGGLGDNVILGTWTTDVINGGGGNDTICGGDSADTLFGGRGEDRLFGEGASDRLFGGQDDDQLFGGDGADTLSSGPGDDYLFGGDGDDVLASSRGNDRIEGGEGDDRIYGQGDIDTIFGGPGNDKVRGGGSQDLIYGGRGNDHLFGDGGVDRIFGGTGLDHIWGGSHGDYLYGEGWRDIIRGGWGADTIDGGSGNDDLYGEGGSDIITGDVGNDLVRGGNGNDDINGGWGDDRLYGETGNDTIVGDAGADLFDGGDGGHDICSDVSPADFYIRCEFFVAVNT